MNNVEAFKNELKNYHYYISTYKHLAKIYEDVAKDDDELYRFKLLKPFYKKLDMLEKQLDETFTTLTGFHAIRYDKEPTSSNVELSSELKLELIDKYERQLKEFQIGLEYAEANLIAEMNRISDAKEHIKNVLKQLPKDIAKVCIEVYCVGKKYEDISNDDNIYWSASGLYWNVNKELEKVLDGMDK